MQKLSVHNDLYKNGEVVAYQYSCPIFIAREFGVALAQEDNLVGNDAPPSIRNGTLTFISHDNNIYGLTCKHVVEELNNADNAARASWKENYNFEPPEKFFGFFFPKGSTQIHINSEFYFADGDSFTNQFPDVAIAKISSQKFSQIGRQALPVGDLPNDLLNSKEFSCIAQGYPELSRNIKNQNMLSVSAATALAPCIQMSNGDFTMQAELSSPPNMNNGNLSGMSGGPVLWSADDRWGLLGIVKRGRDLHQNSSKTSVFSGSVIWIDGLMLTEQLLLDLIRKIPCNNSPLKDKSKTLYAHYSGANGTGEGA